MRTIALATLLLTLPLLAQEQGEDPPIDRARAAVAERDGDHDGKLSVAEFGGGERIFALLDRDGDGFLVPEELAPRRGRGPREAPPRPAPPGPPAPDAEPARRLADAILERHDKDGDGRLSKDEMPPSGRIDMAKADGNGDGFVDAAELAAAIGDRPGPQGGPRGGPENLLRNLKRMDANDDGQIDRAEWKGREEAFARLDSDGDGVLTRKELRALAEGGWRARTGEALFRRADKDGDGRITREEWTLQPEFFDRFDANGDGAITADEVAPRGPGRARYDTRTGKDSAHFLDKYDKDRDGKVTREEFPHGRRFEEMDADGDGVLTAAEVEEAVDRENAESGMSFLDRYDLDGDGKVTREEFTGAARAFEARDRNHDGVIDASDG